MTTPLRVDLVDLSHHNAVTKAGLKAAMAAGVLGIYHKAIEGSTVVDSKYRERQAMCRELKIPFGPYHFARPEGPDAKAEAEAFIKAAGDAFRPGDLRPMLDLEDTGGLTTPELTQWVIDWVLIVERATGARPIIYTPFNLGAAVAGYDLWVARYSNTNAEPKIPAPWKAWTVRQFSNGGYGVPKSVAGLGYVDLNTLHSRADFAKLQIPKPAPVAPKPSISKPKQLNLVELANVQGKDLLATLDKAIANGRVGKVRVARAAIAAALKLLPAS